MDLSSRIASIRKEMRLSQEKFGELVNMSQRSVAAWESGERTPSYPVLVELADKLGVTVDFLLGRSESPKEKEPAVSDSELREATIERIKALPDSVLLKLLELLDAVQSCQAAGSVAQAAPGSSDPPSGEQPQG